MRNYIKTNLNSNNVQQQYLYLGGDTLTSYT